MNCPARWAIQNGPTTVPYWALWFFVPSVPNTLKFSLKKETVLYFALLLLFQLVNGHGRLEEPPSRSTMWRFGFSTPHNYNDHELYCGGLSRQIKNEGKCGICGDAYDLPTPRPNEDGGKYGKGIVVRKYSPGQVMDVIVELTANHMGYFEFKLCPVKEKGEVTEECMDKHPLHQADGSGHRYYLPSKSGSRKFNVKLALPKNLSCKRCVFQWTYVGGNNWGKCKNKTEGLGCGPQETFRACSDISIGKEINDISEPEIYVEENNEVESSSSSSSSSKKSKVMIGLLILVVTILLLYNFSS